MGKNYKETRERLRRLLHKKKVKRRANPSAQAAAGDGKIDKPSNPGQPAAPAAPPVKTQDVRPPPVKNASAPIRAADKTPKEKKTVEGKDEKQALQDLIDFIEGSEGQCRNEKKAAKRVRQKEKKQMILLQIQREEEERIRKAEEERIRKEREAAMLENLRKAALKKKKGKKKNNENAHNFANGPHQHHQMMMQQQLQQQQQQQYNHHQSKTNCNAFGFTNPINNSNPASPIVTIKKIMENDSEPTVTITLRGATPKQDKVLYTLLNGKVCEPGKNSKGSKNFKDLKMNKETERPPPFLSKKGSQPQKPPLQPSFPAEQKPFRPNPVTNYHMPTNPSPQSTRELTNPTSIQINNAVSSMTRNGFHDFNFPGIRLPPEITITKVDPTKAKFKTPQRGQESHQDQISLKPIPKPVKKAPTPEVIYVSTNKLKQEADLAVTRSSRPVPDLPDKPPASGTSSKKRRKKKDTEAASKQKMSNAYPGLDIEIVKSPDEQNADICQQMSFLTINPYTDGQEANGVDQPTKTAKKKRKKKKKTNKAEGGTDAEDWNTLDNVFVPKHLDLNDGEMDDAERELEAFKLFCMQSVPVPLDRKEKVNLNLKDLVLKKKSVSCS